MRSKDCSTKYEKVMKLNWFSSPSKLLPHGLTGIVSVLSGLYLIYHSITGQLQLYGYTATELSCPSKTKIKNELNTDLSMTIIPWEIIIFAMSTFLNALAGYKISRLAQPRARSIFRRCGILQMCLSYYILRFLPQTSFLIGRVSHGNVESEVLLTIIRIVDILLALATIVNTLSFNKVAIDFWKESQSIACSIIIGTFGILLLSVYPLQLALLGQGWWECIQERYSAQGSGMVAFIYVPATVTFSLMLFGATLYSRKIISEVEFGLVSSVTIIVCLVGTVLSQELHIPFISTQRIYLPCHEPEIGTMEHSIVHLLDFSRYARMILSTISNIKFEENTCAS